jgi:multiple antibiotic resistance protein
MTSIFTVTLILFSVIDVPGNLPIILDMKRKGVEIHPAVSTLAAGILMVTFLFFGASLLGLFGLEVESFALAGALIIFLIGLEMTLGIRLFRNEESDSTPSGTLVPIAFPLLAGAGTLTTIVSLKSEYDSYSILAGILLNLALIFLMLRSSRWLERKLSARSIETLRKVFGILVIAIAFQMFRSNLGG